MRSRAYILMQKLQLLPDLSSIPVWIASCARGKGRVA